MRLAGGRLGEHRHRHPPADHPTLLLRHLIVAAVKNFWPLARRFWRKAECPPPPPAIGLLGIPGNLLLSFCSSIFSISAFSCEVGAAGGGISSDSSKIVFDSSIIFLSCRSESSNIS